MVVYAPKGILINEKSGNPFLYIDKCIFWTQIAKKNATFQRFWPIFVRFWPLFYTPATVTTLFMFVFDSRGIRVNEIGGNSFVYINKNIYQQITGLSLTLSLPDTGRSTELQQVLHTTQDRKKKKKEKKRRKKEEEEEKEKEKKEK